MRAGASIAQSREPLSPTVRCGLLALIVFFHGGGGWALTQVEPVKLIVGDIAPMEVRLVAAEQPPGPEIEIESAEPPPPVDLKPPPPPDLATIVDPPPPDLPPPEFPVARIDIPPPPEMPAPQFPVAAIDSPPPPDTPTPVIPPPVIPPPDKKLEPKPAPSKRVQKRPTPSIPAPTGQASPNEGQPQQTAPRIPAAPRTVSVSQLGYLVPPNPVYPTRSRRSGEQGTVTVRVLVDIAGRPSQVSLQGTSGHSALDEAALAAVRAAQFRPYAESGVPQAVWVLVPINFRLH